MSTQVNVPLTLGEGVEAFLEKNQAKESFGKLCRLARKHFSRARRLEAELNEHGYEPNVWEVWTYVILPASALGQELREQGQRFNAELNEKLSSEDRRIMGIVKKFEKD